MSFTQKGTTMIKLLIGSSWVLVVPSAKSIVWLAKDEVDTVPTSLVIVQAGRVGATTFTKELLWCIQLNDGLVTWCKISLKASFRSQQFSSMDCKKVLYRWCSQSNECTAHLPCVSNHRYLLGVLQCMHEKVCQLLLSVQHPLSASM